MATEEEETMALVHTNHPEIWLRPAHGLPYPVLSRLVETGRILATPRLGVRDEKDLKGYKTGATAPLRILGDEGLERFNRQVRIETVVIRPLREITPEDLFYTAVYHMWQEVQRDLSFFEKRPVGEEEMVSIIRFSYL